MSEKRERVEATQVTLGGETYTISLHGYPGRKPDQLRISNPRQYLRPMSRWGNTASGGGGAYIEIRRHKK